MPSDVANDSPLSLIVWWRPDQDRGPLRWALQAYPSTSCTRSHIMGVRSFRPSTGVFLWDTILDTASVPCCMLAFGMSICLLKQVVIVGFVMLAIQLMMGLVWRGNLISWLMNSNIATFSLLAFRRPGGMGLTSGPLVNGPFYIQVMSWLLTVMLLLDEVELKFCWMVGLLRRGELLERHGRLCHLGLCVPY